MCERCTECSLVYSHVTRARSVRQEPSPSRSVKILSQSMPLEMGLRDELLKSIWHAFTALDLDKSGKVSKSQLKV